MHQRLVVKLDFNGQLHRMFTKQLQRDSLKEILKKTINRSSLTYGGRALMNCAQDYTVETNSGVKRMLAYKDTFERLGSSNDTASQYASYNPYNDRRSQTRQTFLSSQRRYDALGQRVRDRFNEDVTS